MDANLDLGSCMLFKGASLMVVFQCWYRMEVPVILVTWYTDSDDSDRDGPIYRRINRTDQRLHDQLRKEK